MLEDQVGGRQRFCVARHVCGVVVLDAAVRDKVQMGIGLEETIEDREMGVGNRLMETLVQQKSKRLGE